VTANAYFLPRNGALKTHLSHQKMRQNSRTATWVLKNFPGVNPRTPNKGEEGEKGGLGKGRGGEGEGEGMGKGRGRGRVEGVGKVKCFSPQICCPRAAYAQDHSKQ
jgi:hypothetical protein